MMISVKGQHIFKIFVYKRCKNYTQSYFVPSLLQIEWKLKKLEKVFQWLPPTQTTWPQKGPILQGHLTWTWPVWN